ncbi:hypothetical protein AA0113_g3695 [Alternaria arborescens]|uniref:Uncharacterized protein n=1 Tax=Alternaria arborescens TaxID=156630 RepID=A0A4Q4SHZ0_9PLEO|nr:hypothetical protein AA0111_g9433 [Alternaria arborescens]RYO21892.1 hypothetical protein AA0111_g9433 [Alternaria arborescens]RYO69722.1 hypothetical protein AA0113_g3695 [Alternaria arborescens]
MAPQTEQHGMRDVCASLDVEIRIEARGYTSLETSRMHP